MSFCREIAAIARMPGRPARGLPVLGVLVVGLACASSSERPPALAPQTVTTVAGPEVSAPSAAEPRKAPTPSTTVKTIVIDPGGETESERSLVAAAEAERERRVGSAPPTIVINDANLKSKAVGQLTVANPAPREAPPPAEPLAAAPTGDQPGAEDYWRGRLLQARMIWRELIDEVDELEGEVNLLRRRFYDEDDPYYRDSQIKPAWDRALDRLREARTLTDEARELVASAVDEGRRRGAMPGWLREGIELEPGKQNRTAKPRNKLERHETQEPQIYDPDDDGGGGA